MTTSIIIWKGTTGKILKKAVYSLPIKEALIAAVEQYKGNYNFWTYPKELEGIYKSQIKKDRLLYDLTDDLTIAAQA